MKEALTKARPEMRKVSVSFFTPNLEAAEKRLAMIRIILDHQDKAGVQWRIDKKTDLGIDKPTT